MSEKRTHEELAAKFLNDLSGHNYEADLAHAIGIIVAAEERGRRRGVEEAMDLLSEAREHLQAFWGMVGSKPSALAYQAPRDSGKETK